MTRLRSSRFASPHTPGTGPREGCYWWSGVMCGCAAAWPAHWYVTGAQAQWAHPLIPTSTAPSPSLTYVLKQWNFPLMGSVDSILTVQQLPGAQCREEKLLTRTGCGFAPSNARAHFRPAPHPLPPQADRPLASPLRRAAGRLREGPHQRTPGPGLPAGNAYGTGPMYGMRGTAACATGPNPQAREGLVRLSRTRLLMAFLRTVHLPECLSPSPSLLTTHHPHACDGLVPLSANTHRPPPVTTVTLPHAPYGPRGPGAITAHVP